MLTSRLLVLFPLLAGVLAVPDPRLLWPPPAPMPGYTVQDLEWEVEVFPGEFHNFTGTVQDVHRQATQLNPRWAETLLKRQPTEASTIHARGGHKPTGAWIRTDCKPPFGWKPGRTRKAFEGMDYLERLHGSPVSGPGPGLCGRVSCSWDTAIWWCNDAPVSKTLESWKWIVSGAQQIIKNCRDGDKVLGQSFNYEQFNVIIREDRVNC